jgi:YebC/PmpR family DNA-binding regulatory protein
MAGHSKWKNIRLRKGRQDAQKGKTFTKLSRDILMAARRGGPDPEANYTLKDAIQRARDASMPSINIERLLEKARGAAEGDNLEEVTYEGYGPAGVAILVDGATDNRNRMAADMRLLFSKNGGNMGEGGCVGWLFETRGLIQIPSKGLKEDDVMMAALELGALDLEAGDEYFIVYTEPTALHQVRTGLVKAGYKVESGAMTKIAKTTTAVSAADAPALLKLLDLLEDHDDVEQVYANFDISPEVWEALGE